MGSGVRIPSPAFYKMNRDKDITDFFGQQTGVIHTYKGLDMSHVQLIEELQDIDIPIYARIINDLEKDSKIIMLKTYLKNFDELVQISENFTQKIKSDYELTPTSTAYRN